MKFRSEILWKNLGVSICLPHTYKTLMTSLLNREVAQVLIGAYGDSGIK